MTAIPQGRQSIDDLDIQSVAQTLRSAWITQGPKVKEFEEALCAYTGAKHAVAVSSGTAALHLCMLALGIGPEDCLITSPITFAASANCALYVGAHPYFVDINEKTWHIDVDRIEAQLKVCSRRNRKTVLVPVHFMGTVVDMVRLHEICRTYGVRIVEDAAHALGATYLVGSDNWARIGSCYHSDMTIFSFHPIKHITTGEGGAVLTNNSSLYNHLVRLRHHGITKHSDPLSSILKRAQENLWFYDIPEVAYNFRITDFQCALGLSQLRKLDGMVQQRRNLAKAYNNAFSTVEQITTPFEKEGTSGSYHLYTIRVPEDCRDDLYSYLRRRDIYTQVNYIPTHLFTYYQRELDCRDGDYPVAEQFFNECLSLPMYPGLSDRDQTYVISSIEEFFAS